MKHRKLRNIFALRRDENGNLPVTLGLVIILSTIGLLLTSITVVNLRNSDLNISQSAFNSAVTRCQAMLENSLAQNFPDDLIQQVENGSKTGGTGTKVSTSVDEKGRTWTQWTAPYNNSAFSAFLAQTNTSFSNPATTADKAGCNEPGNPLKLKIEYDPSTAMKITTLGDLASAQTREDSTKIAITVKFIGQYKNAQTTENVSREVDLSHPEIFGACDTNTGSSGSTACGLSSNAFIYYITSGGTSVWALPTK